METNTFVPLDQAPGYGRKMAQKILSQGGKALMAEIKKTLGTN
jgi:hypothetical protein